MIFCLDLSKTIINSLIDLTQYHILILITSNIVSKYNGPLKLSQCKGKRFMSLIEGRSYGTYYFYINK